MLTEIYIAVWSHFAIMSQQMATLVMTAMPQTTSSKACVSTHIEYSSCYLKRVIMARLYDTPVFYF